MDRSNLAVAALAAFASVGAYSIDAAACGGFFCNGAGPNQVNQAAERIVFAQHPDNRVTAVIQILYDGPADRFGWLLPVPGIPEVELSSDAAFTALQNATNPQYDLNVSVEGECKTDEGRISPTSANNGSSAGDNFGATNNSGDVNVLARGAAGPYDYVVIQVDSANGDNVQLALDWLKENNYEVTNAAPELLEPYLDEGFNLLAIRLQKTSSSGSIRPVRLTYDTEHPMIPIKLTAVAANEDMGVMTWVLGQDRAVPVNYKSLELNDALLNWFAPFSNYNQVVISAANEASGQGFVTEYAQKTDALLNVVYTQNDEQMWTTMSNTDWTGRERELLDTTFQNYVWRTDNFGNSTAWDGIGEVIDAVMPNLTAQEREDVLSCGECAFSDGVVPTFDTVEYIQALDDFVVAPMRETQELIDGFPFVTRLYTTLSAHEMTLDPSFDFNPDLGEVSNVHTANQIIECDSTVYQWEAPWRVELPSGLTVRGTGSQWPVTSEDGMMPATLTVSEVGTSGEGEVVRDNFETVAQQLDLINAKTPELVGKRPVGGGGGGCATTSPSSGSSLSLLALALLGFGRLRRRG